MSEDVPEQVRRRFDRAVSFVVVLDLIRRREDAAEYPVVEQRLVINQNKVKAALEEFPSFEPTTEGLEPAVIVEQELEADGVLESNPGLRDDLHMVGAYLQQRDEPVTLQSDGGNL